MPIKAIKNVAVFNDGAISKARNVMFVASPGNIVSSEEAGSAPSGLTSILEQSPDTVIDGTGCTLLPGLIDVDIDSAAASSALQTLASFGVATVIDMSSSTAENRAMRAASQADEGLPTYLSCGTVAVGPGTQASHLRIFPIRAVEVVRNVQEAEAFVNARVTGEDNSDFIKTVVEQPASGLNEDILKAIASTAHRHGKLAVAHIAHTASYEAALRSGFDILTHVPVDSVISSEVAAQIAAKGVVCVPLLCRMKKVVPLLKQKDVGGGKDEADFGHALATVKKLRDAGVKLCIGTGATEAGEATVPFGDSLHEEMELMLEAGLSNVEILQAATSGASQAFKLQDRGLVGSGLRADLVLVEGNPLEDITATRRIRRVWIKGVEVDNVSTSVSASGTQAVAE